MCELQINKVDWAGRLRLRYSGVTPHLTIVDQYYGAESTAEMRWKVVEGIKPLAI